MGIWESLRNLVGPDIVCTWQFYASVFSTSAVLLLIGGLLLYYSKKYLIVLAVVLILLGIAGLTSLTGLTALQAYDELEASAVTALLGVVPWSFLVMAILGYFALALNLRGEVKSGPREGN